MFPVLSFREEKEVFALSVATEREILKRRGTLSIANDAASLQFPFLWQGRGRGVRVCFVS